MENLGVRLAAVALIVTLNDAGVIVPTQTQIDYCRQDARYLCAPYLGDNQVVRACMLANIPHLSKQCQEAIGK